MKFQATKLDLDLDLETLSGEKVFIEGPKSINATQAADALEKISKEDEKIKKAGAKVAIDLMVKSLIGIYGKDEAFWLGNFDAGLLSEIRKWFSQTLIGVKKKD